MRVHANHPLAHQVRVFLDGEELVGCCTLADEYTGMVEVYTRDEKGEFIFDEHTERLKSEQRFGKVRIEVPSEAMPFFDWGAPA